MTGPPTAPRFCANCGRPNNGLRTTCWGCGAPLPLAAYGPGPSPPLFSPADARSQPPGFARPWVPPGYSPPPARPPKKGLSTAAIVVIIIVAVIVVTSVPAAILYVLVSGLTRTGASTPYELGMTVVGGSGISGPHAVYYVNISLSPTLGLTTALFGLAVFNESSGFSVSVDVPSASCTYDAHPVTAACTSNGSGWYAVLTDPSGSILATYGGSGGGGAWANMGGGASSVAVGPGQTLIVVSGTSFVSGRFDLSAFPTGPSPVSGAVEL
jgi:hypothetical protein